tara:strand:- start:5760 stop:5984 length:225 start_codon:yes stop_codon:yes gene_type:complete
MHIPDKHPVEDIEKLLEEGGRPQQRPELGIKIVINAGGPPSHRPMPMKKKMKKKMKAKRIGGSGPMEDALSAAY